VKEGFTDRAVEERRKLPRKIARSRNYAEHFRESGNRARHFKKQTANGTVFVPSIDVRFRWLVYLCPGVFSGIWIPTNWSRRPGPPPTFDRPRPSHDDPAPPRSSRDQRPRDRIPGRRQGRPAVGPADISRPPWASIELKPVPTWTFTVAPAVDQDRRSPPWDTALQKLNRTGRPIRLAPPRLILPRPSIPANLLCHSSARERPSHRSVPWRAKRPVRLARRRPRPTPCSSSPSGTWSALTYSSRHETGLPVPPGTPLRIRSEGSPPSEPAGREIPGRSPDLVALLRPRPVLPNWRNSAPRGLVTTSLPC